MVYMYYDKHVVMRAFYYFFPKCLKTIKESHSYMSTHVGFVKDCKNSNLTTTMLKKPLICSKRGLTLRGINLFCSTFISEHISSINSKRF